MNCILNLLHEESSREPEYLNVPSACENLKSHVRFICCFMTGYKPIASQTQTLTGSHAVDITSYMKLG